jgi:hypothetical protein
VAEDLPAQPERGRLAEYLAGDLGWVPAHATALAGVAKKFMYPQDTCADGPGSSPSAAARRPLKTTVVTGSHAAAFPSSVTVMVTGWTAGTGRASASWYTVGGAAGRPADNARCRPFGAHGVPGGTQQNPRGTRTAAR